MLGKKLSIITIAVQALLFYLMTSTGNISFLFIDVRSIFILLVWVGVFAIVDYTYTKDIKHAIKIGIIYTVIWGAVGSGVEYLLFALFNRLPDIVTGAWYGVQNVLCLGSALAVSYYFFSGRKKINKLIVVAMVAVFIVFIITVNYIIQNVPTDFSGHVFNIMSMIVYHPQDIALKRVSAIFYGIEGVLSCICFGKGNK